jgi:hypothetical protein
MSWLWHLLCSPRMSIWFRSPLSGQRE